VTSAAGAPDPIDDTSSASRRDRTSRVVAVTIVLAIVIPVLWLVLSTALGRQDPIDPSGGRGVTTTTAPRSTTVP
jgi:predicted secreted protein